MSAEFLELQSRMEQINEENQGSKMSERVQMPLEVSSWMLEQEVAH